MAAPDARDGLAGVVDTLSNRLGADRVSRVVPFASHVPERAVHRVPPLPLRQPSWVNDPAAPRPIRLLRRPEEIEVIAPVPDDPPITVPLARCVASGARGRRSRADRRRMVARQAILGGGRRPI